MIEPGANILDRRPERVVQATRAIFLVAGLAMSAWAPLVPLAKARLAIDDGALGGLLLFLGIGSIIAMPITGVLTTRIGCRIVILVAGFIAITSLPLLALLDTWAGMAAALAVFGAAVGTVDVAMNIQAVEVESRLRKSLMSGFHGLFSLGGIFGAGAVSLLLAAGLTALQATATVCAVAAVLALLAASYLLPYGGGSARGGPLFVLPKGAIIYLGFLCILVFLAEGAVLDWSAVFLTGQTGASVAVAGFAYAVFAIAMTIGRLSGDWLRKQLGEARVLLFGGLLSAAGFVVVLLAQAPYPGLAGFFLVGLGAANVVPVLFSAAGRTRDMPAGLGIASVTTMGYAAALAGPALIGLVAELSSLALAFGLLALAMLVVGLNHRVADTR